MSTDTLIDLWKHKLNLSDWDIIAHQIAPEQILYNGEKYFVGIHRDFGRKKAIIYHDIALDEESIVHELLHIVYPEPNQDETFQDYERWITEAAENLTQSEDVWKPISYISKMFTGFQPHHHLEAITERNS